MLKTLKICGFDFELERSENIIVEGEACLGCCLSDKNKIMVKNDLVPQRENEVILHESIHAVSDVMDLDLTEHQVNTIGVVLVKFIADNKEFVKKVIKHNG